MKSGSNAKPFYAGYSINQLVCAFQDKTKPKSKTFYLQFLYKYSWISLPTSKLFAEKSLQPSTFPTHLSTRGIQFCSHHSPGTPVTKHQWSPGCLILKYGFKDSFLVSCCYCFIILLGKYHLCSEFSSLSFMLKVPTHTVLLSTYRREACVFYLHYLFHTQHSCSMLGPHQLSGQGRDP